jgi:hypothetical protein
VRSWETINAAETGQPAFQPAAWRDEVVGRFVEKEKVRFADSKLARPRRVFAHRSARCGCSSEYPEQRSQGLSAAREERRSTSRRSVSRLLCRLSGAAARRSDRHQVFRIPWYRLSTWPKVSSGSVGEALGEALPAAGAVEADRPVRELLPGQDAQQVWFCRCHSARSTPPARRVGWKNVL